MAAALIYQHASRAAAQTIADYLDAQLAEPDESDDDDDGGAAGALAPTG